MYWMPSTMLPPGGLTYAAPRPDAVGHENLIRINFDVTSQDEMEFWHPTAVRSECDGIVSKK